MDDFDRIEIITRRVGRAALVGIPWWILMLWVLPLSGMGVMPCLLLATLLAVAVVVVDDRRRCGAARRAGAPAGSGGGGRASRLSSMSPLAAVGLTLLVMTLLVYVVLVMRQA